MATKGISAFPYANLHVEYLDAELAKLWLYGQRVEINDTSPQGVAEALIKTVECILNEQEETK